jgi:uncharacterized protein YjdB
MYNIFSKIATGIAIMLFLAGCKDDEENKIALQSIDVTPASVTLTAGGTQQLTATAKPADASDVKFNWTSASTAVATVSADGLVTAVAAGSTTVTVASGNIKKDVPVMVNFPSLTSFTVTPSPLELRIGDAPMQLTINKTPTDASANFTYASDNTAVVTVSTDGLVMVVGLGTAAITVTSGSLAPVTVPVTVSPPALKSFTVTPPTIEGVIGDAPVQLTVTKTPVNAESSFTYVSANPGVATVDENGLVTTVAVGSTEITVASDTLEVKVPVTVVEVTVDATFDRYRWEVTASNVWQNYAISKIIDGDKSSYWHSDPALGTPVNFVVDMKGNKLVNGFYFVNRQDDAPASPKVMTVETSRDNATWTVVYSTDNLSTAKTAIMLELQQPTIARYFKVTIAASHGDIPYTYFAETGAYNDSEPYVEPRANRYNMSIKAESANRSVTFTDAVEYVRLVTIGEDPNINTFPIGRALGGTAAKVIFEYKSNKTVTDFEMFWCVDGGPVGGKQTSNITIEAANDWRKFELDLAHAKEAFGFGQDGGHFIRLDPSGGAGYEISIRNFRIETNE